MATSKFKKLPEKEKKAAFANMRASDKKKAAIAAKKISREPLTFNPKKVKGYYALIQKPNGTYWTEFISDDGVAGVRAHIKKMKWRLESKLHTGKMPRQYSLGF